MMVIDAFGLSDHDLQNKFPSVFQHLLRTVKPERDQNNRKAYRDAWWIFGEPRAEMRPVLSDLKRYIATVRVAKHRVFQFLDAAILPESRLIAIGLEDGLDLGVLSSRTHVLWALAAGGRHGVGNDPVYYVTRCFDPFPFPDATEAQRSTMRDSAEQLDAHRKKVLAEHQDLTLTGLYNVLEKLKSAEALSAKEKSIHERGLVSVMKHLHEQIDAAVFEAYGWPKDLSDEEILARLVELNKERRAEEARGHVRWLRPEYQAPRARLPKKAEQTELDIAATPAAAPDKKIVWPGKLPERVTSVRTLLGRQPKPVGLEELSKQFQRARRDDVQDVLNTLVALGLARRVEGDQYAP